MPDVASGAPGARDSAEKGALLGEISERRTNTNMNTKKKLPTETTARSYNKRAELDESADNGEAQYDRIRAGGTQDVPPGRYHAVINEFVVQEADARGQSVRAKFDLAGEDYRDTAPIVTWYKIFDDRERIVDWSVRNFKIALAKLGYENVPFRKLPMLLAEITDEHPGVMLRISYRKDGNGTTWQRVEVEGPCDDDVIRELKASIPY
jgi:hypothetical protein